MSPSACLIGQAGIDSPAHKAAQHAGFATTTLAVEDTSRWPQQLEALAPAVLIISSDVSPRLTESLLRAQTPQPCQVILTGGEKQQRRLAKAITRGRAIYVGQPLDDQYLADLLQDIFEDAQAALRTPSRTQKQCAMDQFGPLYGSSGPMREMYRFLRKAAASEAVLCIHGESGSGKELVAEAVHAYSPHSDAPFEAINCAAIPAQLVESELFGHEKGSFSGAISEHIGIFERVGTGTLLLDEITEMPQAMQVKLLRVLESGKFRRVGGEIDHSYHARVIAATNREPLTAVKEGKLREDLFYRISQLEVRVPPLRERGQDIVDLSRRFIADSDQEHNRHLTLTKGAEKALLSYDWPGNVRQLWNVTHKACINASERIEATDLPLQESSQGRPDTDAAPVLTWGADTPLHTLEERAIKACLKKYGGDKQRTAEVLGISLRTLYARLEKYRHLST